MNNNHPNIDILKKFAYGQLDDQLSVIVSGHVEYCSLCRKQIYQYEDQLALETFNLTSEENKVPDFSILEKNIVENGLSPLSFAKDTNNNYLSFKNKQIPLPHSLSSITKYVGSWDCLFGKISFAPVNLQGKGHMYFVHFEQGAKIPKHSHDGNEYAYIVAGSFCDSKTEYISGDFASFNEADSHAPYTNDPDGCLLLVSLDGPFYFKEGFAKLLNPFRKFLFNKL